MIVASAAAVNELGAWTNFYVITGSAAGALTGLMFIVITLVAAQQRREPTVRHGVETFSSPTVVHFCAALLLSGIMAAPWHSFTAPAVLLALMAVYGVTYASGVLRRMIRMAPQSTYTADLGDWLWYAVVPLAAYIALLASAIALALTFTPALLGLAACAMVFIFLGIRNAWDTVTFIAVIDSAKEDT